MKNLIPERCQLGFIEAVKLNFAFVKMFGLEVVEEENWLVRYQSGKVALSILHEIASFELYVVFNRVKFPKENFDLDELLNWMQRSDKLEKVPVANYQTSSRESVQKFVPLLAELVKQYAGPLLQGDAAVYEALRKQQSFDAAAYTKEVSLRAVRRNAEVAWQHKDYETLASLFKDIRSDLTPSEVKKLQYAERHLTIAHRGH
jgi:hypothetical protein